MDMKLHEKQDTKRELHAGDGTMPEKEYLEGSAPGETTKSMPVLQVVRLLKCPHSIDLFAKHALGNLRFENRLLPFPHSAWKRGAW